MKSRVHFFLLAMFLIVALVTSVVAQQAAVPAPSTPTSDPPATREDIQRLFKVMHVRDQIRTSMEVLMAQQHRMIGEMLRKRNRRVTEADIDEIGDSAQDFLKNFPLDGMVEDMIPVYQNHLTKADVDVMASFYASPTGQKLVREQAAMAGETMELVSGRVQKAINEAMARADQKAKEDADQQRTPAETPEQRKN